MIDQRTYRQVLGQYPTGVCVITAMQSDGSPAAMVVGSFTSVSLDPPLVAFFPDRNSASWAKLKEAPSFCVNILSAEQEAVCRKLASKEPDKFADLAFEHSPSGSPLISGVVAWIDCDLHSIGEAGDHFIVMGLVRQLDIAAGGLPLLFFQGGYGRFAPSSIVASDAQGLLAEQLRIIDCARPEMERVAAELSAQCVALTRIGDEMLIAASAGQGNAHGVAPLIGQRLPFMPPIGSVFAAWLPDAQREQWLGRCPNEERRDRLRASLGAVRERGYSVWLLNDAHRRIHARMQKAGEEVPAADLEALIRELEFDPVELTGETCAAVRLISAPIFDRAGNVVLSQSVSGFPRPSGCREIEDYAAQLLQGADRVTALLGGHRP